MEIIRNNSEQFGAGRGLKKHLLPFLKNPTRLCSAPIKKEAGMIEIRYRLKVLHEFKDALTKVLAMVNISENTRQELIQKRKEIEKAVNDIITQKEGIL